MMLPAVTRRPARLIEQLARPLPPLLAALFEDSGSGTLVLDRDRRIVRTNRRFAAMWAASGAMQAAGAPWAASGAMPDTAAEALFAPTDRPRVATALAAALRGNAPPPLQIRLSAENPAAAAVVELSIAPLCEADGEVSGLLLRLTDVSLQQRLGAELAQLQKLQAVGQLAGGIAHDFNNLLMAIIAAADAVLERESCAATTLDDLRQIRESAERGAALVRQLLAFGRRQPLQPVVVAVNTAVLNLSGMLVRLLGERIRLQLELEEPGRSVRVDPRQFDQVLVNLALNGRDAMPAGGTLTLRTGHLTLYQPQQVGSETMPPGRYVTIGVEDTGEGIPPATLKLVFEPFFTTRRGRSGSGLGLSAVHGIVRQSNGFVTVESTLGQGTCVSFWLPRHEETELVSIVPPAKAPPVVAPPGGTPGMAAAPAAQAADAAEATEPVEAAQAERLVLLVEDEAAVRRLIERALTRAGWQVLAVDSAEAALEQLPRPGDPTGPPRVLVSDIMLPGMDGTELLRAVRAVWPNLPAVLVSGYTDSALVGNPAGQGVAFLAKPFMLRDLVACVERAVA